ncbi:MAG: DnaJ domain-containing protein [Alphaproteobacteria bacterium]|nr:DnaJ domain-containing protein [Alphaproteobacteria bacterium]
MFDSNTNFRSKKEAAVTVRLTSGDQFSGYVFLKIDERLIDLMNDPRSFIPIKRRDGGTVIIAKSAVESLRDGFEEDAAHDGPAEEQFAEEQFAEEQFAEEHCAEEERLDDAHPDETPFDADTPDSEAPETGSAGEQDAGMRDEARDEERAGGFEEPANPRDRLAAAYRALRIAPSASDAEVKAAYKMRMKSVHPDAQIGAGPEKERAALHATQLVNRAYQAIMRERGRPAPDFAVN